VLEFLKRLLKARGVLFLATRFGTTKMRQAAMDEVYKSGTWDDLDQRVSEELVEMVEAHAGGGDILDLGCGPGLLSAALAPEAFASYLGVDVSAEAIAIANKRASEKVSFQLGDIERLRPERSYDLIVFTESIMYVNPTRRLKVLKGYADKLKPRGRLMVTVVQYQRFEAIFDLIASNFEVVEDRMFRHRERRVIVFS